METVTDDLVIPGYASLAIDEGRFYFRSFLNGPIYSGKLDGSDLGVASSVPPQVVQNVDGNALDSTNTYTYVPYPNLGIILRVDAQGDQTEFLNLGHQFAPNIAIDLDETNGRIYWAGSCNGCNLEVGSASLDGTGMQVFTDSMYDDYHADLALDTAAGKVYWKGPNATIRRANLDFTGIEDVIQNNSVSFNAIALDVASVPEPGTLALAALGSLGLLVSARGKR